MRDRRWPDTGYVYICLSRRGKEEESFGGFEHYQDRRQGAKDGASLQRGAFADVVWCNRAPRHSARDDRVTDTKVPIRTVIMHVK